MIQNGVGLRHLLTQHLDFLFRRAGAVGSGSHDDPDILLWKSFRAQKPFQEGKDESVLPLVGNRAGDVGDGDGHLQLLRGFAFAGDNPIQSQSAQGLRERLGDRLPEGFSKPRLSSW